MRKVLALPLLMPVLTILACIVPQTLDELLEGDFIEEPTPEPIATLGFFEVLVVMFALVYFAHRYHQRRA